MKTTLACLLAACLLAPVGAMAQNTIPNGMSNGTVTFSPAPAVPNLSAPTETAPVSGSLGTSGQGARPSGSVPRRHRARH